MTNRCNAVLRYLVGAFLALVFAGIPVLAEGDVFGFEPEYWDQSMSGTVAVDGDTLPGSEIDLQDDLGLEATDKHAIGRFWIHWMKRNSLIFTMGHSNRHGDQVLTNPIDFDDQSFLAGEQVQSRVETDLKSLLYNYDVLNKQVFKLGLRVGVDWLGFDATLDSVTTPTHAERSESVTIPAAGIGIVFEPIPLLRFLGEINGSGGHISGNDVTFYDARLQAEIYWSHYYGITAGYRRVKIDAVVESTGKVNLNQKGPYAGFIIRF
jgi:hypothetical protein